MDLYDFRNLIVDDSQPVRIYNLANDAEVVFEGDFCDLPSELECCEICSIDNLYKSDFDGYIGINIELEDEDE